MSKKKLKIKRYNFTFDVFFTIILQHKKAIKMNKKIMTISIILALGTTSAYAQNLEIQENKEQEKK